MPITGPRAQRTIETMVADLQREVDTLKRRPTGSSFDPNEDPVTVGLGATASGGSGAVALGHNASADGTTSVSIGNSSFASGTQSIAVGDTSNADNNAIAIGDNTNAYIGSVAVGTGAQATGTDATALGANTNAAGDHATAVGVGAHAPGSNTIVIGTTTETTFIPGKFAPNGSFDASHLPTSNPGISGRVWWDTTNNVLAVSP